MHRQQPETSQFAPDRAATIAYLTSMKPPLRARDEGPRKLRELQETSVKPRRTLRASADRPR
jgi:hypothetical protein